MSIFELLLIGVGLAMDAFAVSVGLGLSLQKVTLKKALIAGLYFGIFQAVMPLLGYFCGFWFAGMVSSFDHWIVFILLAVIGGKMIFESLESCRGGMDEEDSQTEEPSLSPAEMLPLAVATSIDALAVGVSFAFLKVDIFSAASVIGVVTCVLSMAGVKIGAIVGAKFKAKAEFAGGLILVLIGLKTLLEHMGLISF